MYRTDFSSSHGAKKDDAPCVVLGKVKEVLFSGLCPARDFLGTFPHQILLMSSLEVGLINQRKKQGRKGCHIMNLWDFCMEEDTGCHHGQPPFSQPDFPSSG